MCKTPIATTRTMKKNGTITTSTNNRIRRLVARAAVSVGTGAAIIVIVLVLMQRSAVHSTAQAGGQYHHHDGAVGAGPPILPLVRLYNRKWDDIKRNLSYRRRRRRRGPYHHHRYDQQQHLAHAKVEEEDNETSSLRCSAATSTFVDDDDDDEIIIVDSINDVILDDKVDEKGEEEQQLVVEEEEEIITNPLHALHYHLLHHVHIYPPYNTTTSSSSTTSAKATTTTTFVVVKNEASPTINDQQNVDNHASTLSDADDDDDVDDVEEPLLVQQQRRRQRQRVAVPTMEEQQQQQPATTMSAAAAAAAFRGGSVTKDRSTDSSSSSTTDTTSTTQRLDVMAKAKHYKKYEYSLYQNGDGSDDDVDGIPTRYMNMQLNKRELAYKATAATLQWRHVHDIDSIVQRPHPYYDIAKAVFPHYFVGRASGHVVFVQRPALLNLQLATKNGLTQQALLEHYIYVNEYLWQVVEAKNALATMIGIMDMRGLNLSVIRKADIMSFMKEFVQTMDSHYPQRAHKTIIVNAPKWFHVLYKIVSPILRESTKSKIEIYAGGKRQDKALLSYVGKDAEKLLPKSFFSKNKKKKNDTKKDKRKNNDDNNDNDANEDGGEDEDELPVDDGETPIVSQLESDLRSFTLARLSDAGMKMQPVVPI